MLIIIVVTYGIAYCVNVIVSTITYNCCTRSATSTIAPVTLPVEFTSVWVTNGRALVIRFNILDFNIHFSYLYVHLCISDAIMGLYALLIWVSDVYYHGGYLWYDVLWKHGTICRIATGLFSLSFTISPLLLYLLLLRYRMCLFPWSWKHLVYPILGCFEKHKIIGKNSKVSEFFR